MEVYILDDQNRRIDVVDQFKSFIWTERFTAYGDFELDIYSTLESRNKFKKGIRLAIKDSYRVMTVETVEDTTDDDEERILKVTGTSLESALQNRVAIGALTNTTDQPKWTIVGNPKFLVYELYSSICYEGILSDADIIQGVTEADDGELPFFPADTNQTLLDDVTYDINPTDLYTAMKTPMDQYLVGFRMVRDPNTSDLYWNVYSGCNRTIHQTQFPAIVFSPNLDNLQNTSELSSISGYKNVAYVISPVSSTVVYGPGTDESTSSFDRRVMVVQASDITADMTPEAALAAMQQLGVQALADNRQIGAFDGEISQYSTYRYGTDYNVGDMVSLENIDGVVNDMQVTEQIFVSDGSGDRSYPTLTLVEFIAPGTWASNPTAQVWNDLDADPITWSEEPEYE